MLKKMLCVASVCTAVWFAPVVSAQSTDVATPLWQDSCHHLKFNQLGALRVDSVSL